MTPLSRLLLLPVVTMTVCAPAQATVYMTVAQAQKAMIGDRPVTPVPIVLTPEQTLAVERDTGTRLVDGTLRAWKSDDEYFFVDAVIGKHDLITYAATIGSDGKLRKVEILEYREAYGSEVHNPRWLAQFTGHQHGDTLRVGEGIQNISGATLSCQHLTEGIRRLLSIYANVLKPANG